jgi:hypothetical protein
MRQRYAMRSSGFTVGCVERLAVLSPPSLFIRSGVLDATRPTPGRDADFSHVIVRDGMLGSAFPARLPPFSVSKNASAVESLVSERINQLKVVDSVVEFVLVAMVNPHSRRNGAVVALPNKIVLHSEATLGSVPDTPVALGGDASISTRSIAARSSPTHTEIISYLLSPSSPALLSLDEALAV